MGGEFRAGCEGDPGAFRCHSPDPFADFFRPYADRADGRGRPREFGVVEDLIVERAVREVVGLVDRLGLRAAELDVVARVETQTGMLTEVDDQTGTQRG